jgi:hypothetical protein
LTSPKQIFERDHFRKRIIHDHQVTQAQECLRELYKKSLDIQGEAQIFGGNYQEVTINADGPVWSAVGI